jgi:hypothetical protein
MIYDFYLLATKLVIACPDRPFMLALAMTLYVPIGSRLLSNL